MPRAFRKPESYAAEKKTRGMVAPFLLERGFSEVDDRRKSYGPTQSQLVRATDSDGKQLGLWVRLCWRREGRRKGARQFSAAQLRARIEGGDWEGTVSDRVARAREDGATHLFLVQREGNRMVYAALVPLSAVLPIWKKQRDISKALIKKGRLGRRKKNHATNGSSPTIWLQDSTAPGVAEALWRYPGVRDLAKLPVLAPNEPRVVDDDSLDDLPVEYRDLGSDGAERTKRVISGVRRDPRVRTAVRARSGGRCEREGCGGRRPYNGFLDVHHILGAENSDRFWNCVALCPNCHRDAHFSPDRDQINALLLKFAAQFAPRPKTRRTTNAAVV